MKRKKETTCADRIQGEHAIGIGKKECLVDELGEDTIHLMKSLKQAVDPK